MSDPVQSRLEDAYKAGNIGKVDPHWWARTYPGETLESITGRIQAIELKYATAVPPAPVVATDDATCGGGK